MPVLEHRMVGCEHVIIAFEWNCHIRWQQYKNPDHTSVEWCIAFPAEHRNEMISLPVRQRKHRGKKSCIYRQRYSKMGYSVTMVHTLLRTAYFRKR